MGLEWRHGTGYLNAFRTINSAIIGERTLLRELYTEKGLI